MEPIYQRVKDAIGPEGTVPEAFALELEPGSTDGEEMSYGPLAGKWARVADGKWDCEILYEYNYLEKREEVRLERLKAVTWFAAGVGDYEEKAGRLAECLTPYKEGEIILCLRELSKWLDNWPGGCLEEEREIVEIVSPYSLLDFADRLLVESDNIESVKYALTVLAQKDGMPPEQREQVRALALCGEFTHYCIPAVLKWEKGMEELFQIAQKAGGAGCAMAVRALRPSTQEMRDWLLDEGWRGGWHCRYNAAACADRGRLRERLEGPVTPEQLERATELIHILLDDTTYMEQPDWKQIEWVENPVQLLLAWMGHLEDRELDFDLVKMLSVLLDVAEEHQWRQAEKRARRLLLAPRGREAVEKVMWEGQDFAVGRKLGLNWQEPLLACAERSVGSWKLGSFEPSLGSVASGRDYYYELNLLFQEGEPWASRVIQVWEKGMPIEMEHQLDWELLNSLPEGQAARLINLRCEDLKKIAGELAAYPGKGLSLVLALLEIPTRACRRRAFKTLNAWRAQGWAWTEEVERAVAAAGVGQNNEEDNDD